MGLKVSCVSVVASLLAGTIACGLLKTSFVLPSKTFSFDTAAWKVPAGNIQAIPCGDDQLIKDCCNPPAESPVKPDCSVNMLSCDSSVCAVHIPLSAPATVDLKKEVPALGSFSNQSLIDVSISKITYTYDNKMNVDLPPMDIFIAPDGVTSATDPNAKRFGTTKTIHANSSGSDDVALDPDGAAAFTDRAHHFGTPFNFIGTTTVVIPSGSAIPSGSVTVTVQGTATASL